MAVVKLKGGVTLDAPDHLFPVQRELMIEEYLVDFDIVRAAQAVGVKASKASLKNLENNPSIREDIKARYEQRYGELGPRAFRLTNELTKLSYSNARDLYDENGDLIPVHLLPDHISACISSMDVVRRVVTSKDGSVDEVQYTHKIRLHDKVKALQALQRQLGLIAPDVNIINNTTINNSTIPLDKLPTWLKVVIINVIQGGSIPNNLETEIINTLSDSLSLDPGKMITLSEQDYSETELELDEPDEPDNGSIHLISATNY